ncbi:hypothetical protein JYG30_00915 [Fibrella sp. USSR17]
MRQFFLFVLFLLPALAGAQATKMIKKGSPYFREQFEVLADDRSVREGVYKKFSLERNSLLEEGQYAANQRVGVWTFYDGNGNPELEYDYSLKKVNSMNRKHFAESVAQVMVGDSVRQIFLDRGPVYLASSVQVYSTMAREARIPAHLARSGQQMFSFKVLATVSASGAVYRVLPSNPDAEFIKTSKQAARLAFEGVEWVPAVHEQTPITATYLFSDILLTSGYSVSTPVPVRSQIETRRIN